MIEIMERYKVVYSEKVSYKETLIEERFGYPIIRHKEHNNEIFDGYADLGFKTIKEAKNRAEELGKISNHKYINIRIESYNE